MEVKHRLEETALPLPYMDGWNELYAVAYVCRLMHLPPDPASDVVRFLPKGPYEAHPEDPDPYFLPLGTALKPWGPWVLVGSTQWQAVLKKIAAPGGRRFELTDGILYYDRRPQAEG